MPAVLIDAGPLVAILDSSDDWHHRCRDAFRTLTEPPRTLWPVLTEACYLLRSSHRAQSTLLQFVESEAITIAHLGLDDVARIRELMRKYSDLPMDLADAAIVRVAEREKIHSVFTIDRRDFQTYRPAGIGRFRLFP